MAEALLHIAENVWSFPTNPDSEKVEPTVGVIVTGTGTVLVDAGNSPAHARRVRDAIAALGAPPAENYPAGWLTTALEVVNGSPQVAALIWYMDDFPHDDQWDFFSLTEQRGQMAEAAAEFEGLLRDHLADGPTGR